MMRGLKISFVTVMMTAALVGLSVSASAARDARPFRGTVAGEVDFLPDADDPGSG
jgi:hypothetical protein